VIAKALDSRAVAPDQPLKLPLGGSRLAHNSILNLIGQGAPLVAAIIAIPVLINGLGTDRFGVLSLAWMMIGYFSLFELGLGQALTQVVAEQVTDTLDAKAPEVVWTAIAIMFLMGLLGGLTVGLISPWLVHSGLKIPEALQVEALHSFYLLAVAIPSVVVTTGLIGILAAYQRFGMINAIRVPMGMFNFLAPLTVLPFSQSLVVVATVLVIGRLLTCAAYVMACRPLMPPLRTSLALQYADLRRLIRFGAWITVTNVISPIMVYLDRFVIGAILSVAAVAFYATPYEIVTKLLIVPGAILGVLFPAFAASHRQDHSRMVQLLVRGTKYIALILFPVILLITSFAREGLQLWLGNEFAQYSAPVLQCLAIGVFINGLAQAFATFIQGIGRPDLSAKLHLLELPLYLMFLWWAIQNQGIVGAGIAWTVRVALDSLLLFCLSSRFLCDTTAPLKRIAIGMLSALAGVTLPLLVADITLRAMTALLVLLVFVPVAWFIVLAQDERVYIKARLGWVGC
jgi:O-antigen/teichoic acid export membrane protein